MKIWRMLFACFFAIMLVACTSSPKTSIKFEVEENHYQNHSDVIVDANGNRSFPDITREQVNNELWKSTLEMIRASSEVQIEPERPAVSLIQEYDNSAEYVEAQIKCMHEAGWLDVTGNAQEGIIAKYPAGQITPMALSQYECAVKYPIQISQPFNEAQMEKIWEYQVQTVIPCLSGLGYEVNSFPSKESFVDQWFAERNWYSPLDDAPQEIKERSYQPDFECPDLPENIDSYH